MRLARRSICIAVSLLVAAVLAGSADAATYAQVKYRTANGQYECLVYHDAQFYTSGSSAVGRAVSEGCGHMPKTLNMTFSIWFGKWVLLGAKGQTAAGSIDLRVSNPNGGAGAYWLTSLRGSTPTGWRSGSGHLWQLVSWNGDCQVNGQIYCNAARVSQF